MQFHPVRPDIKKWSNADKEFCQKAMDARNGPSFVIRQILMPSLRQSYDDLSHALLGADLLITHPLSYAGPVIARKNNIKWISTVLAPISFFSIYDSLAFSPEPIITLLRAIFSQYLRPALPVLSLSFLSLLKLSTILWGKPVKTLSREMQADFPGRPLFEGRHSPDLVLALFSEMLGKQQQDWPKHAQITGFPFYDHPDNVGISPDVARFLESGDPPVVFTLGSAAVHAPGTFFQESVAAVNRLGVRAIILTGGENPQYHTMPDPGNGVIVSGYEPLSKILPLAAAIIHQGGIGTIGQALRAGCPMIVSPFAFDQPDNAIRIVNLGVGRIITRKNYISARVEVELSELVNNPLYRENAMRLSKQIDQENGVGRACNYIEEFLSVPHQRRGNMSLQERKPLKKLNPGYMNK